MAATTDTLTGQSERPTDPLAGGGEMGALMRTVDWSHTAVGAVAAWPQSLRTALSILLETRFPMYIAWGPRFTQFYNDGYRPILGSTKHPAAMGQAASETFAESWHIIGPMFEGVMSGQSVGSEDWMLPLDRHGFLEECYFTFSYSPIRDESGRVGGVLVTVTETTERVLGARRLKTLRDLSAETQEAKSAEAACAAATRVLADNAADLPFALTYLLSADGKQARLAGTTGAALAGELSPPVVDLDADATLWPLAAVARTGVGVEVEPPRLLALPSGGDEAAPRRVVILPISPPGAAAPSGLLIAGISPRLPLDAKYRSFLDLVAGQVATAIAAAHALEEAEARAEALAEIDRAKTAFFSNVSHEFRTPLTLLLGPTQDAVTNGTGLGSADVQLVHRSGLRLLKLVNTLLDFSRIEAGRVQASYEPTDLAALTRDLASVFESAIARAGLRLQLDIAPLDEPVYVDREMWEKIVLNLLSNALKFTFEGAIEVTLHRRDAEVELQVRDSGIGVPAAELPFLFDRFHRVQGARSRTHEGTGIGLALVQELVKLHGGRVRVDSVVDRGTTFTVALPLGAQHLPKERLAAARTLPSTAVGAAPFVEEALRWSARATTNQPSPGPAVVAHEATATPTATPALVDSARILLVDDNADMRDYVARLLSEHWTVAAVSDGAAGLEAARRDPPDLILSDVMMPGLDGFALLSALRSDERTRAIPVIFLSARAGEESRIEGLQAGADDYLVKPFSARELTARVRTHLELSRLRTEAERARARLYSQFMQAPVPVSIVVGEELVFDLANPLYERMVGRTGITGKTLRQAFPELPPDAPILQTLRGVYEAGVTFTADEYLVRLDRRGDGTLEDVYFQFTCQPMRDASDRIFGLMTVSIDVTAQVLARREVESARRLLETVIQQMPAGIIIVAAPSGRLLLANRNVQSILGYPPVDTASVEDYARYTAVHEDGTPYAAREYPLARALEGGVVLDEELRVVHADGTQRVLSSSAAPVLDAQGRIVAAVAAFSDISDRKLDEQLRQVLLERERDARAEAEVANRSKDEFLAMLGHELRNPLAPILTALQLMRLRGDDSLQRERLVIERQVNHVVRLVDDLLDVSRITRGKIELKRERVEMAEVVAKAIEMASPLIEQRQHRLDVSVPRSGLAVHGDQVRLAQVVSNLLNNAAKYTEPKGQISVQARLDDGAVVLRVADNGIGLGADMLPGVFGLFVQERQAIDRAQGGLGLGLAIVRSLVEIHGGTVEAHSEGRGRGSEFVVRLPSAGAEGGPGHGVELKPRLLPTTEPDAVRLLVVDDNVDAAELLVESLRTMGHRVQVAFDGPAALRIAADFAPEVALLDIGLPVMDGYELARHLRQLPGLEAVHLIAVTGYGQQSDRQRSLDAGFHEHLVKPLRLEALEAAIARLRAGRRRRS